jgi:colanic acid/amylovoran biosynthesis protein
MTQILITNAYSGRNLGDAGIILGMLDDLRSQEAFRGATVRVATADPGHDATLYPCPALPSFRALQNRLSRNPILAGLGFLLLLLPLAVVWGSARRWLGVDLPAPRDLRRLMRAYVDSDLCIAAGGGYLYTTSKRHGAVVLLNTILGFSFGALVGRPVYLYGQSIGPFGGPLHEWMVRRALARVRLVAVREEISESLVRSWRLPPPVHLTGDAAFLIRPASERPLPAGGGSPPRVGITVRPWFRKAERQRSFETAVAQFSAWLVQERKATVFLIPHDRSQDLESARRVLSSVATLDGIILVDQEMGPADMKALCGAMDLFVGTRMHSAIYALDGGVPTLTVAYQPKTTGIMAALGLERFVLPIEDVTTEVLRAAFDQLQEQADTVREVLAMRIPEMRERALLNGRLIAGDFLHDETIEPP